MTRFWCRGEAKVKLQPICTLDARKRWVETTTPNPRFPLKWPHILCARSCVGLGAGLDFRESLPSTGILSAVSAPTKILSEYCTRAYPWAWDLPKHGEGLSAILRRILMSFDGRIFLKSIVLLNPLKPELKPICYLLALLGAHHFLHVSRIRVKLLTFRRLMSYIYIWSTHSWCF